MKGEVRTEEFKGAKEQQEAVKRMAEMPQEFAEEMMFGCDSGTGSTWLRFVCKGRVVNAPINSETLEQLLKAVRDLEVQAKLTDEG